MGVVRGQRLADAVSEQFVAVLTLEGFERTPEVVRAGGQKILPARVSRDDRRGRSAFG